MPAATCDAGPLKEGAVAHSTPLECLKVDDPDLVEAQRASSRLYQDTVRQLLNRTRVLSFTKPQ